MAEQNRWSDERSRAGRYGEQDRSRRGFEDYGSQEEYGRGEGAGRYGQGGQYGEQGRSFERERFGGPDYGRAGEYGGYGTSRYGEGGFGGRYGEGGEGGQYGQSQPRYGQGQYGQVGYGQGSYGQGYGGQRFAGGRLEEGRSWQAGGQTQAAQFRGRGPKGYTRSDDRIREDVSDRLTDDDRIDAVDIEIMVKNGEVALTGTVPDRDDKHRAEDIAESVSGVKQVQNNLRIQEATKTAAPTRAAI